MDEESRVELAGQVEQLGRERHADAYAGVELADGTVVVHRRPSPSLDAALRALPGGESLVLRDAPHSARELERLHQAVVADLEHWHRHGLVLDSVGARHDGRAVEVGTQQVERARRELPERYGADAPLEVVEVGSIVLCTDSATAAAPTSPSTTE